ncbi:hypothetical protein [Leptospira sp. 'Mane']|uniref:hypothetical protein n=1 Tax=Leptospira sp. 'Mane' TaxID=3387407 RepID=UPI00398BAFCC
MEKIEILIPLLLLALIFILKAFVNRETSLSQLLSATLELPVDIIFLSLSFYSAYLINQNNLDGTLLIFILGIIIGVITIVFWRISIKLAENEERLNSILLTVINFFISGSCLFASVVVISSGKNI